MTDTTPHNRLGNAAFVVALLGLLLAVIPGSAALGLVVCLFAMLPAFIARLRCQQGRATNMRASTGALLAAPLGLVVAFAVAAANPISPVTTSDSATLASTASSPTRTPPRSATPTQPTFQDQSAQDPSTRSSSTDVSRGVKRNVLLVVSICLAAAAMFAATYVIPRVDPTYQIAEQTVKNAGPTGMRWGLPQ